MAGSTLGLSMGDVDPQALGGKVEGGRIAAFPAAANPLARRNLAR
jgi:hypothetical protein